MAMHSAAALSDELSRTDAAHVTHALKLYVRRQRPAVDAAQRNSRQLARLMMLNSRPTAWLRDRVLRFYSLKQLLKEIRGVMEGG
jgi:2-polyprenyl-6-methoxyphenol hydroxylase-like FAD-dependent oxidoreductase